jgi:hypothetical protein
VLGDKNSKKKRKKTWKKLGKNLEKTWKKIGKKLEKTWKKIGKSQKILSEC